jgi:hypothetical protein
MALTCHHEAVGEPDWMGGGSGEIEAPERTKRAPAVKIHVKNHALIFVLVCLRNEDE